MNLYSYNLLVEINDLNVIFIVGKFDDNQNFNVIHKAIISNNEIKKSDLINVEAAYLTLKKNIQEIEKKLDCIFNEATIVIDNFNCESLNISGFKRLNGSQILKENISYILNSLKLSVTENEKNKDILHIFNSKSILDGQYISNLPIGLNGNFYNHELSFFLIEKNDHKNIKYIFNKNNLVVKKIFIKSFIDGVQLINQDQTTDSFFKVEISSNKSKIMLFDKSSFRYEEKFNFGYNIILKDINKVCYITDQEIKKLLKEKFFKKNIDENDYLDDKYLLNKPIKKIRKKLLKDVAKARIEEIASIILKKNININSYLKDIKHIYLSIDDETIFENFEKEIKFYFSDNENLKLQKIDKFETNSNFLCVANLALFGWKKEAIPITQGENSLITKIFKYLFG